MLFESVISPHYPTAMLCLSIADAQLSRAIALAYYQKEIMSLVG